MEDHGGRVILADRPPRADWEGTGTVATLVLPLGPQTAPPQGQRLRTQDGA